MEFTHAIVVKYSQSVTVYTFLNVISPFTVQCKIFVRLSENEKSKLLEINNILNWLYEKGIYLVNYCFL